MKAKKIIKIFSVSLIWLIVLATIITSVYLIYCNTVGKMPYIGNYAFIKIISGSMEPEIMTGEYILVEKVDAADISVNDVIVFVSRDSQISGNLNTHRVVEITDTAFGREFTTKGDHNSISDSLATKEVDVRGRYIRVLPTLTRLSQLLSHKWVYFILVLIPTLLLVIFCIKDFMSKSKEVKIDAEVQKEVEKLKRANKRRDDNDGDV